MVHLLFRPELYYKNPQFFVTLTEPDQEDGKCTMVVSLILKDYRERRVSSAKKNLIVGFDVHQVRSHVVYVILETFMGVNGGELAQW